MKSECVIVVNIYVSLFYFYELGDLASRLLKLQSTFDGCFKKYFISGDAFNFFKVAATVVQLQIKSL